MMLSRIPSVKDTYFQHKVLTKIHGQPIEFIWEHRECNLLPALVLLETVPLVVNLRTNRVETSRINAPRATIVNADVEVHDQ